MRMRPAFFILPVMFILAACTGGQPPAPVSNFGQSPGAGSAGVHNVIAGETVYSLSKRYNLPLQDIVVANHLKAPFRLSEGQRIKLPPPQEYRAREGDSIYTVSRMFGVNSSEIAKLNRMKAPYMVRPGQVLRLPSLSRKPPPSVRMAEGFRSVPSAPLASVQRETLAPPVQRNVEPAVMSASPEIVVPASKPKISGGSVKTAGVPKRGAEKFLWPYKGKVVSAFGPKKNGLHNDGINIKAPKGSPVRAAENGVVVYAGNELKGSGNLVLLRHDGQWVTAYAHMDKIMIRKGQTVKRGETVGTVGSTGSVSTPQLHFEVRRGTEALNPVKYLEK